MAIVAAAITGFIYFGGSGDYGGFEPPFSHGFSSLNKRRSHLLRVKKLSDNAILPSRASPLSAGYDLSRRRFRRDARFWWLLTSAFRFQKAPISSIGLTLVQG
ncbi:hypothetical protein Ahy_B09g097338 [Arachis hypogaea]|uniref:Uncharacterized protein n=1 Tax=Arachis hypogaea TaxID=3818 RepID=A0A444XP67_ARAHY|nr:hypothetical protein Ahy_B09g097338 [Arachis hypogaea]